MSDLEIVNRSPETEKEFQGDSATKDLETLLPIGTRLSETDLPGSKTIPNKRGRGDDLASSLRGYIEKQPYDPYLRLPAVSKVVLSTEFRLTSCSPNVWYGIDPQTNKIHFARAHFCHSRVCPVCQSVRSYHLRQQWLPVEEEIKRRIPNARWLFLTLTQRNVPITNLRSEILHVHQAWHRMYHRKWFKETLHGWIRATEVTRGDDRSAHPHIHALLLIDESYFRSRNPDYKTHEQFIADWRSALRIDYDPSVNIQAVRRNSPDRKHIFELIKYATKSDDLIADVDWFVEYIHQIAGLRFLGSGGLVRDLWHIPDEEEAIDDLEVRPDPSIPFEWVRVDRDYFRRELRDDELSGACTPTPSQP